MNALIDKNQFNLLADRAGFNLALRHFKTSLGFSEMVSDNENLADVLNDALDNKSLTVHQINSIINILLVDKFGYSYKAHNLMKKIDNAEKIQSICKNWTNLQIILVYYNSSGDTILINPKNQISWDNCLPLEENELCTCFVGNSGEIDKSLTESAVVDMLQLLAGKNVRDKKGYINPDIKVVEVIEKASESSNNSTTGQAVSVKVSSSARMTTKYAVNVTNELFHNGNVEAWKRIIESYKVTHAGCEVHIWYEGEKINDINALFKWGKVKHGCPIMFGIQGDDIRDVSKLRKYLFEGASQRFEAFLHGHPGTVLELF